MEQELTYKNIAIIGCGATGGLVSILLTKNPYNKVTAFDTREPFSTLLPTGGGRCNITNAQNDVREFVRNYPRGEKFLISLFSRFGQSKTRELFKDLGIKTYVQDDGRVFPVTDSSEKTIFTLKKHLETSNFVFQKEKVVDVIKQNEKFIIKTTTNSYEFDYLIITTGGRGNGFDLARKLGHNIINPQPSLCALDVKEKGFYNLTGMSFSNVEIKSNIGKTKFPIVSGDILFSHKSITGPAIFKVSALSAFENFDENNPLEITIKIKDIELETIENLIKENQKKTIKNVFSMIMPERFVIEILNQNNIDSDKQISQIKKHEKEILINSINSLKLHAINRIKDSEIVTAGGVDLKEVNPKTMESKIINNLYLGGELLNIDGYTGGFNLQNCWSCAYIISLNFN